jgi:RNase P/RNase MRP subunit p29
MESRVCRVLVSWCVNRYERLAAIHEMWKQYTGEQLRGASSAEEAVSQLDLHGSQLRVARHRNAQLVGAEGIVIGYNDGVFHLVSRQDKLIRVGRLAGCEFHIRLDAQKIAILMS